MRPQNQISIHAPTRGATIPIDLKSFNDLISIHAPTRGATSIRQLMAIKLLFQSTLPREERRSAWNGECLRTDFNPRSHERSDYENVTRNMAYAKFQSTLPREERPICTDMALHRAIFQSTLPREERQQPLPGEWQTLKFQSTLPREERQLQKPVSLGRDEFQSTLPREERQQYCTKNLFIFIQYRQ